jgi:hypothetical protein
MDIPEHRIIRVEIFNIPIRPDNYFTAVLRFAEFVPPISGIVSQITS